MAVDPFTVYLVPTAAKVYQSWAVRPRTRAFLLLRLLGRRLTGPSLLLMQISPTLYYERSSPFGGSLQYSALRTPVRKFKSGLRSSRLTILTLQANTRVQSTVDDIPIAISFPILAKIDKR